MAPFQEDATPADNSAAKQALMDAGDSAYDEGDFSLALDRYHRACLLDRSDPRVWCALGMTYYSLDFNREAWRSYLLALMCAPADPDTLWYCAEFMAGVGGTALARIFLKRYLEAEEDAGRIAEARELLASLPADAAEAALNEHDQAAAAELLAGAAVDPLSGAVEGGAAEAASADAPEEEAEEGGGEAEVYGEAPEGAFIANLALQLEGIGAHCRHCATGIPYDAPYCYACLMPHFYEEV